MVPHATIQVFPIPQMRFESLPEAKLPSYLATDGDTRIFLVTGPLTGITGLQEQYHP